MKLLFIIGTMQSGGAQKVLLSHINYLLNRGYLISLVSLKKSNIYEIDERINYIELIEFDEKITTNIFYILQELSFLVKECDIVIGFSDLIVNYITFTLSQMYSKPVLLSSRTQLSKHIHTFENTFDINKDLTQFIYSRVNILVPSEFIKKDIKQYFNIKNKNIYVLPNPIDLNLLQEKKTKNTDICIVGRLSREKNHQQILKAFALIKKDLSQNIKLNFIGDGPELGNLKELCIKLSLSDNVVFEGYHKDVLPFIYHSHLMILSSKYEGFPNVILEAFSQKTLVLASDIEPVKEIVKHNETGILFSNDDIADLALKMKYCLTTDLRDCIENAYESLRNYKDVHQKFENILLNIIGK